MKISFQSWIILLLLVVIGVCLVERCESKKIIHIYNSHEIDSLKNRIEELKDSTDTVKVEVIKWKEAKKSLPKHKTKFDSTANIDIVLVELSKCDTITKIDSILINKLEVLIQNQDTIIRGQEEIIFEQDLINQHQEKKNKKLKRKLLFTKILAGAVVVLTILLTTK